MPHISAVEEGATLRCTFLCNISATASTDLTRKFSCERKVSKTGFYPYFQIAEPGVEPGYLGYEPSNLTIGTLCDIMAAGRGFEPLTVLPVTVFKTAVLKPDSTNLPKFIFFYTVLVLHIFQHIFLSRMGHVFLFHFFLKCVYFFENLLVVYPSIKILFYTIYNLLLYQNTFCFYLYTNHAFFGVRFH